MRKNLCLFFCLIILGSFNTLFISNAQIIPEDRLIRWVPGVNAGVPGGIPERKKIGVIIDAAKYGNGQAEASEAIEKAIESCPRGQVVFIPAGTYRIEKGIRQPHATEITLRGAGMGKTILLAAGKEAVIHLGNIDEPRPANGLPIKGGATKGSTVISVDNTSAINVGNLVRIEQDDLPYVKAAGKPATNNKSLSVMFRVTGKTKSTVKITPAVPFEFTLSPVLIQYANPPIVNTGVEDLTVDCNAISWAGIAIDQAWGCWVRNVEIMHSTSRQMMFYGFVAGEIRQNYTHSVNGGGPNYEGIDFYEDGCFNLIEDNIVYNGGFPGIILGDYRGGCAGNAITYNYCDNVNTGYKNIAGMDISVSHGPHNVMNLVEGNIAGGMGSDGYHGSTSHATVARNWLTAEHPTCTGNRIGINIGRWNNYFNIVGNVIGTESFSPDGLYEPVESYDQLKQVVYKIGFPNMGNSSFSGKLGPQDPPSYVGQEKPLQEFDLNVKNTMILHGNYDYKNKSVVWDPGIKDHKIPASYIYKAKPAFFGDCPWPPIGPDVKGYHNDIPAKLRYERMHGAE
jgi:hypothetical protein